MLQVRRAPQEMPNCSQLRPPGDSFIAVSGPYSTRNSREILEILKRVYITIHEYYFLENVRYISYNDRRSNHVIVI